MILENLKKNCQLESMKVRLTLNLVKLSPFLTQWSIYKMHIGTFTLFRSRLLCVFCVKLNYFSSKECIFVYSSGNFPV